MAESDFLVGQTIVARSQFHCPKCKKAMLISKVNLQVGDLTPRDWFIETTPNKCDWDLGICGHCLELVNGPISTWQVSPPAPLVAAVYGIAGASDEQ